MKLQLALSLTVPGFFPAYAAGVLYNQFSWLHGITPGPSIDRDAMPNSALLVIDVQQGYPPSGVDIAKRNPAAYALITQVQRALTEFRSRSQEVVFIAQIKEPGLRSFFLPHVAPAGSKQAEINERLEVAGAPILTKLRADAFSNPELATHLESKRVGRLFIVGMAAEVCVNWTVQSALQRGYEVFVVREAIFALFGQRSRDNRLLQYARWGAKLISIDDVPFLLGGETE